MWSNYDQSRVKLLKLVDVSNLNDLINPAHLGRCFSSLLGLSIRSIFDATTLLTVFAQFKPTPCLVLGQGVSVDADLDPKIVSRAINSMVNVSVIGDAFTGEHIHAIFKDILKKSSLKLLCLRNPRNTIKLDNIDIKLLINVASSLEEFSIQMSMLNKEQQDALLQLQNTTNVNVCDIQYPVSS